MAGVLLTSGGVSLAQGQARAVGLMAKYADSLISPSSLLEGAVQAKLRTPYGAPLESTRATPPHLGAPRVLTWEAQQRLYGVPAQQADPRPRDPWLARDKAQHLAFSFLWTLGTQYSLVNKADWSERRALPASIAVAGAVGLAKEVYDARRPRGFFSTRDLVADAAGIALASIFILL
ncbi:MAG: hypothetical protein AAF970_15610 [Bacteroidota bacterium]